MSIYLGDNDGTVKKVNGIYVGGTDGTIKTVNYGFCGPKANLFYPDPISSLASQAIISFQTVKLIQYELDSSGNEIVPATTLASKKISSQADVQQFISDNSNYLQNKYTVSFSNNQVIFYTQIDHFLIKLEGYAYIKTPTGQLIRLGDLKYYNAGSRNLGVNATLTVRYQGEYDKVVYYSYTISGLLRFEDPCHSGSSVTKTNYANGFNSYLSSGVRTTGGQSSSSSTYLQMTFTYNYFDIDGVYLTPTIVFGQPT